MTGQRKTWQRERVQKALVDTKGFVSAQELHAQLAKDDTGIGIATVYRALSNLTDAGQADTLRTTDGESLYRACMSEGHHHHLICRTCHNTIEIEAPVLEQWTKETAEKYGFHEISHVVDIFGLCPSCSERNGSE